MSAKPERKRKPKKNCTWIDIIHKLSLLSNLNSQEWSSYFSRVIFPFFLSASLFSLHSTFYLEKVDLISIIAVNPGNKTDINGSCWGLFFTTILHQKLIRFFISSVKMQSIPKIDSRIGRSIPCLLAAFQKNPLTFKVITSQVVQWPRRQKSTLAPY